MDKVGRSQSTTILKKGKKKHAKDELDRLKQAEKKKRRLEKALAASAAIRSELEKKKQKKFEEQQRLDKEGAAIAESVALHVLGEDTDEPYLNSHTYNPWEHSCNIGLYMGCATDLYGSACRWNVPGVHMRNFQGPYYEGSSRGVDMSVGLIAAQAVSTLNIGEDPLGEQFTHARASFFNGMIGNSNLGTRVDLYKEY